MKDAICPKRKLVKISDPNLWKPPQDEGLEDWQKGYEIRNDAIGISIFTTGTDENVHYHEKTWELYQVLEGSLKIAVKHYRTAQWEPILLNEHDMLLLAPGVLHLVDNECNHITQVIQVPPALSDSILFNKDKDAEEVEAAKTALRSKV